MPRAATTSTTPSVATSTPPTTCAGVTGSRPSTPASTATIGGHRGEDERAVGRGRPRQPGDEGELVEGVADHAEHDEPPQRPARQRRQALQPMHAARARSTTREGEPDRGERERREAGERALGDAEVDAPDEDDEQHAEVGGERRAGAAGRRSRVTARSQHRPLRLARPPCRRRRLPALYSRHVTVPHPQLLHRRPHRPRQVHPGRPAHRGDRHGREAPDARAGPRHHGPRARARHHHQAQRRPHELHRAGRRGPTSST